MTTPPMPDQVEQRIAWSYSQTSSGYDSIRFLRVTAARLLELAALEPGEQVLDVATGTGHVALAAAQQVGPSGRVVGIDLSEGMLEQARRKAATAGQENIEFRIGDAERREFPDANFDVVLCASAIFFFRDQEAAAREWWRVLRPGGRALFSSFGDAAYAFREVLLRRLEAYGVPTRAPQPGGARRAEARHCAELLQIGGFTDITTTTEQLGYYFGSPEECWDELRNGHAGVLARLAPEQVATLRSDLLAEVATLATEAGIWRDLTVNFACGRKP